LIHFAVFSASCKDNNYLDSLKTIKLQVKTLKNFYI